MKIVSKRHPIRNPTPSPPEGMSEEDFFGFFEVEADEDVLRRTTKDVDINLDDLEVYWAFTTGILRP